MIGAVIGGIIGGIVGAVAWAAIVHFSGWELGIVAWGIGILVGVGAQIASGRRGGVEAGVAAALIAVASVGLGKVLVAYMFLGDFASASFDVTPEMKEEIAIAFIADDVVHEREVGGQVVQLDYDREQLSDVYPGDIWAEAERRWAELSEEHRAYLLEYPETANPDWAMSYIADDIVIEYEAAGKPVEWPGGEAPESPVYSDQYPADVWAETEARWGAMSDEEKAAHIDQLTSDLELQPMSRWSMSVDVAAANISPFDLLWAGLALLSAFQLARGQEETPGTVESRE